MTRLAALGMMALAACLTRRIEPDGSSHAPAPVAMDPQTVLGTWSSSSGLVRLALDPSGTSIEGSWTYQHDGDHVGTFRGVASGNVLHFTWREPVATSMMEGEGWIAFEAGGHRFRGEWWTQPFERWTKLPTSRGATYFFEKGSRYHGVWTGWR